MFLLKTFKALNGLLCADVPLRNYSLTHFLNGTSAHKRPFSALNVLSRKQLCTENRDVPDFTFPNPAGAGTGARFENLVQHKTTQELE